MEYEKRKRVLKQTHVNKFKKKASISVCFQTTMRCYAATSRISGFQEDNNPNIYFKKNEPLA